MAKRGCELTFLHSGDFLRQNPGVSDHLNDSSIDRSKPMIKEVDFFSRTEKLLRDQDININGSSSLVDSTGINVRFSQFNLTF